MKKSMPYAGLIQFARDLVSVKKVLILSAVFVVIAVVIVACQKQFTVSQERIVSFQLMHSNGKMFDTAQLATSISDDSVCIKVSPGADVSKVYCKITYEGVYITPEQNALQDFSSPAHYTIAGNDGTSKTYTVIVTRGK